MSDVDAEYTAFLRQTMPFGEVLGIEVLFAAATGVVARVSWAPERCTSAGVIHGGYLMACADSIGAACAVFNLPQGAFTSTIESKTNFFRAVTEGTVTVSATPLHAGRTTIVVQTDITRPDGKLVTRTIQTQAVLTR